MSEEMVENFKRMKRKTIKAAEYIANGDPYRDVMDDRDIAFLIAWAAGLFKEHEGPEDDREYYERQIYG